MIEKNNTLKILEFFFNFPERKFHLRELCRLSGLSLPTVKEIAEKLEKKSILKSEKEKVVKNFYASQNEKFIHLKKIYNIYSITFSGILEYLKEVYEEPYAIILFGSYSKGEDNDSSDIDLAVITSFKEKLDLSPFEKKLLRKINLYEMDISQVEKTFLTTLANGVVLSGYLNLK